MMVHSPEYVCRLHLGVELGVCTATTASLTVDTCGSFSANPHLAANLKVVWFKEEVAM